VDRSKDAPFWQYDLLPAQSGLPQYIAEDERNFINTIAGEGSAIGKTILELEIAEEKNSFGFDVKKAPETPDFFD